MEVVRQDMVRQDFYCIVCNADGDGYHLCLPYKEAAFGISMRLTNPAYVRSPSVRYIP